MIDDGGKFAKHTATITGGELKGKSETVFTRDFNANRD